MIGNKEKGNTMFVGRHDIGAKPSAVREILGVRLVRRREREAVPQCSREKNAEGQPSPELVKRFRKGEEAAMEELYREFGASVLAYLRSRCFGQVDASEVSQDTWIKVWKSREQFREGNFRAWLFAITKSVLADHIRREARFAAHVTLSGEIASLPVMEEADDELLQALRHCLQTVGGRFVEVLRQRLDGLSTETIARRMGISVATVYTRANRGRDDLKNCIEQRLR